MRRKGLVATLLMLSLAFVCLIFSPVLSAEDPWDVDTGHSGHGGLGDSGDSSDTTTTVILDTGKRLTSTGDQGGGWFDGLLWRAGFGLMWDLYSMIIEPTTNQATETPTAR